MFNHGIPKCTPVLYTENDLFEPEIQLNSPKMTTFGPFSNKNILFNDQTTYLIHTTNVATRFLSHTKFF